MAQKKRRKKTFPGQHYDVATKVLMDKAAGPMLDAFLGIQATDIELIDELPQESVSLKRSDYILRVIDTTGQAQIVLWEFLSQWRRNAVLSLCDYGVRALMKYDLPIRPVILLLASSPHAADSFESAWLSFRFTLIKVYDLPAAEFMARADVHLLPFVPVMRDGEQQVWEAEHRIYSSALPAAEKADLLAALTIFAGFKGKDLVRQLVERRRDLMIQSYAYDIIKQEGIKEGLQQGIQQGIQQEKLQSKREAVCGVLEARFDVVPINVLDMIHSIEMVPALEDLLRKAITVEDLPTFVKILQAVLTPV